MVKKIKWERESEKILLSSSSERGWSREYSANLIISMSLFMDSQKLEKKLHKIHESFRIFLRPNLTRSKWCIFCLVWRMWSDNDSHLTFKNFQMSENFISLYFLHLNDGWSIFHGNDDIFFLLAYIYNQRWSLVWYVRTNFVYHISLPRVGIIFMTGGKQTHTQTFTDLWIDA